MVLKKPSDYFKKDVSSVNQTIQRLEEKPELNTFSDAFESFKNNLSKIEILSEFSETLDNYRVNVERVNHLSEKVDDIQMEIENLLKKEDLDRAMMSQLLVVEQSIRDVQTKVKGINESNLVDIRLDVSTLTKNVNQFLENDVPKYKKLVVESELRTNQRYDELENNVNITLEGIGEFIEKKYDNLTETLQGINENSLSGIIQDFKLLDKTVSNLKEQEIPKYKGFIVETERKTESKLNQFDVKLNETLLEFDRKVESNLLDYDEKIDVKIIVFEKSIKEIDDKFELLKEQEIPKYKNFIVETEQKTESKLNQFDVKLDETLLEVDKKFENNLLSHSKEINNYIIELREVIKEIDNKFELLKEQDVPKYQDFIIKSELKTESKINEFQEKLRETTSHFLEKVSLIEGDNSNLIEDINSQIELVKDLNQQVTFYIENTQIDNEDYRSNLTKKVTDLEIEIIRNESHIKVQNKNLQQIQEDVRFAIERLNIDDLEENNYELGKKVKYLEEIFEKFNEKTLTEGLLSEPPEVKSSDSLTPLDQKFVTIEQLQEHYRLFINRIQQQLSTIGGGGETRLKYLDDIVGIATNSSAYHQKYLQWNAAINKAEFVNVSGSGSSSLVSLTDVDSSNLSGISTDYIMVYNPLVSGFKFVDPKIYFGINNDANPAPDIVDYGTY